MTRTLIALLMLTACTTSPTQVVTLPPIQVEAPAPLAWKNAAWDAELYAAIHQEGLTKLTPQDAKDFALDPTKPKHWARLLVEMAKWESNWKPTTYAEAFTDAKGRRVVSTGLFQISVESMGGIGCKVTQAELLTPERNIQCAVKAFAHYVRKDSRIAGLGPGQWRGRARYWAVLRGSNDYTDKALKAIKGANR